MKKTLYLFLLFATKMLVAQNANIRIIPEPVKLTVQKGIFTITPKTALAVSDKGDLHAANFFNQYLKKYYHFQLQIKEHPTPGSITIHTKKFIKAPNNPEFYSFQSKPSGIDISGNSYAGSFYGIQTLIQLLPVNITTQQLKIPIVSIEDEPRFAYRGMHLDVGRHFFSVDFIKEYIDLVALHKMNTFHWHLTEDQGWRIEIKQYPRLTSVGAYRNGTIIGRSPGTGNDGIKYGGYYTQQEIKEVVQYAADRFITVIPEIEMPGHASAAIAAYPALSCFPDKNTPTPKNKNLWNGDTTGKQVQQSWGVFDDVFCPSDYTFHFLENVLDEVMELFPSKYIHIGGDECPKNYWKASPFCQQLMQEKGIKDEHELQSYFIQRIEKYINSKGRQIIGWDEILEGGLAPNATVMSWRGEKGGIEAAQQKHYVIMTPGAWCYFDHSQNKPEDSLTIGGYTTVQKVYSYEPVPKELNAEEAKYVLGAQGNVWTEYMKYPTKVEYMILPRMSALSEVLWSPANKKNWQNFQNKVITDTKRYRLWQVHFNEKWNQNANSVN
ncbi:MAG: beta-N-acetylhexosaminidase [Sphingobacteriales bacterium]|uniref:beta-N-acetylhexosaminidase n=1 Tax=Hydrotalea flava TaxID=714549 RepID=UPI00083790B0|nr:beta-N-acetylhexosaminidase [Hydrotalea flava]RTL53400.1 MAG: beta-N-acetylhexosaminidase [Sphingobacteriales bacterium]